MMRRHTTRPVPSTTSPSRASSLSSARWRCVVWMPAFNARPHEGDRHPRAQPHDGQTFKVEVKTTERGVRGSSIFGPCFAWLMDESHGALRDGDLIYAFVVLDRAQQRHRIFLVPAADVASYIRWEYKHWRRHSTRQTGKVSPMRMFRIPEGSSRCPTPSSWRDGQSRQWERNWSIFEK
jgi:hypothetical protein